MLNREPDRTDFLWYPWKIYDIIEQAEQSGFAGRR